MAAGARDGQLRIRRGADSPPWALQMFDDDLGLWLTLAQADEEAEMVRAGIPVLRGPYTVDFTDIPHDGNTMTLWTPAVGDVLLGLFADRETVTQWDQGGLYIGQNVVGGGSSANILAGAYHPNIGNGGSGSLDFVGDAVGSQQVDSAGATYGVCGHIFHSADPVQIQLARCFGTDPTIGHVELYALVTRAVAP